MERKSEKSKQACSSIRDFRVCVFYFNTLFFRHGLIEKTQSGTNLTAFTPRHLWIRVALFEKRLQKIVAYLVAESDK